MLQGTTGGCGAGMRKERIVGKLDNKFRLRPVTASASCLRVINGNLAFEMAMTNHQFHKPNSSELANTNAIPLAEDMPIRYSYRNDTTGSTRDARCAGMYVAARATATSSKATDVIAMGSLGLTP